MSVKSAYKKKPAENIPTEDEITAALIRDNQNPGPRYQNEPAPAVEPPAEPSVAAEAQDGDSEAVQQALAEQAAADAAKADLLNPDLALKHQLDAMRQAEQMQRERMAMAARIPRTPEQLMAVWKQQGLSDREGEFLLAHPEMVQRPRFLAQAANEVNAPGIERDSDDYFAAIQDSFARQMDERAQRKAKKASKNAEPVPQFFTPSAKPPEQPQQSASSIYSAPVSREIAGGGGRPMSPRSITLTPAEREAARMSGISETEYAKNKLLMLERQSRGETQR